MKFFRNFYLVPIALLAVAVLASRPGGNKGGGGRGAKGHSSGGSNHMGLSGGHNHGSFGNKGGHGAGSSNNQGQGNAYGSQGVNSIVNAIRSADQQAHSVNSAIQSIKAGDNIKNFDSTLQSLTYTIETTSTTIDAAGSLQAGDVQSLNSAIQPFQKSIGTLVTQLVSTRDQIAQLCGCRVVEGAMKQIRSSTRVMFDGIKNHVGHGSHSHGKSGFSTLHSLDSGIASHLNYGLAAFGFSNCIVS